MSVPPALLNKVKLLLKLAQSPNPNEADNARLKAEELIAKHGITEADLASLDEKVFYGEDEKLFTTIGIVGWKQVLSLAIATYFDCQIVQEQTVALQGGEENVSTYAYFVYGDDDQVKDTQFVWGAFLKKINYLVATCCLSQDAIYLDSYCEGVVESIKWNIQMYGIEIPEIKKKLVQQEEQAAPPTSQTLTTTGKEEPTENRVNVNAGSLIKDIQAYFRGIDDGKNLSLQDILELEVTNKESAELPR